MPITKGKLQRLLKEIDQFQNVAAEAVEQDEIDCIEVGGRNQIYYGHALDGHGSKHTGALRRSSLDLTRALAEFRR